MADQSAEERTEQPTSKRRSEALDEGNVAKSQELNSVAILITGVIALKTLSSGFGSTFRNFVISTYRESSLMEITVQSLPGQIGDFMKVLVLLLLPLLVILLLAGLGINIAQIGLVFAKKALKPQMKKLNPLNGLKKMFSGRSLVELVKGLLKITIVGLIGYFVLDKHLDDFFLLAHQSVPQIFDFTMDLVFELTLKVGIALLIMAVADYAYQKWEYEKSLKMSKQQVKDEMKQSEGDPKVKGRIRSAQQKMAISRMMHEIPEATVVVTNPTHIAIALKYEPESSADAPKVVAKGKEYIAQRIKKIAAEHDIPIIENKPLARGLFESCEIGMEIPFIYYQAVAEILSQVYQAGNKKIPLQEN